MRVLIAGDFGRIHEGHLDHIRKAYYLSDFLYIVTHSDESIRQRKGYDPMPLYDRIAILRGYLCALGGHGIVLLADDTDGRCVKTLERIKPDIFAKGGGYTLETLPKEEVEVCQKLGIKIICGVGDRLNESRTIAREKQGLP